MTTNSDLPGFFGETIRSVRPHADDGACGGFVISPAATRRIAGTTFNVVRWDCVLPGEPWMPYPEKDMRPIRSDLDCLALFGGDLHKADKDLSQLQKAIKAWEAAESACMEAGRQDLAEECRDNMQRCKVASMNALIARAKLIDLFQNCNAQDKLAMEAK